MSIMSKKKNQSPDFEVVPIIRTVGDDDIQHVAEQPFCSDPTCGCHEDQELIAEVVERVQSGELTPQQATDIVKGKYV